ncbi:ATP-binding cassette domain-containing protein [Rhodococcus sp. IEGM 1330]|uniref:ABC transporter ATP-binding protein n=1 Tax=Rhodococcus sp. IEGM 1330 TaxID=3082225 RepID=UPI002954EE72|nr:ATP-binding cassette domain-containing protein [Rhodococcus sp. IEGM 1330]MDV8023051.1 ATP-binding cassette domain-containing protein [Rhodococcus sp. IEGM 1330]
MSFSVEPGEIFGFVGSNGAGKSTTMRIVLGVQSADAGRVLLDGRDLDHGSRRSIGYMPEERGLYPKMQVAEQLRYLARLHGATAERAAENTERWIRRLGLHERADDNVGELSLGNQQRAQLAAALVHDPSVLVLDEPFSGLDPIAVDVMSDVLKELAAEGVPILFSSHQLDLVERLCDRVGIIAGGRMRAQGSVDDLRSRGASTLRIDGRGPAGWADGLPGVVNAVYSPGTVELSLSPGADEQSILQAALELGPVHRFAQDRPSLSTLFREVVAQ